MFKPMNRLLAVATVICGLLIGGVADASAASLYVSNSAPVVPAGKSCAQPGYGSIQQAINASAGATINVCPGTYTEQLSITSAAKLTAIGGAGTATVKMPAAAVDSTTACDNEQKDEIAICTSGTVSITGLNVEAIIPLETCAGGLYGIFVGGGATLKATNVAINGASTSINASKGCQHGIAVRVGRTTPAQVGHASLKKVTVTGYQKNGPTVTGAGSTLTMSSSSVTGEGPSPYIAQNGIEVAFGGLGKIKSTSVSGNECNVGVCGAEAVQASGVLFFEAAKGSNLTTSIIKENDMGAYYASGANTVPATADVTLTKNVLTSNRYEGVVLEEGKASLKSNTINGSGRVGIDLFQYEGQTSASESSATGTKISGQAEAAIKVESDKAVGDIPGKFMFTKGTATGNGSVLINESNAFEVIF